MNIDAKTPFEIIYEDNHLLCVIKPSGVVSEADEYHLVALDTILKEFIKKRDQKSGNVFLTPVHRLDKPASGIVIFAKTSKALERMHKLMQDRKIEKTYVACLEKTPPFDQGILIHYLKQGLHKAEVVDEIKGKKAELEFKVIIKKGQYSLLEIQLHTGRYHQIRAQMAAIGCPIIGDKRYGAITSLPEEGIALCHIKSSFIHPVKGTILNLEHPLLKGPIDTYGKILTGGRFF